MCIEEEIMRKVLEEAKIAYAESEVPVACIIVRDGEILSVQRNRKEAGQISTSHAELLAIEEACRRLGRWRLHDCKLYVNLEPCLMCLGAILEARIAELIYSLYDYRTGGINGSFGIGEEKIKLTKLSLKTGILAEESKNMMQSFFRERRTKS